MKFLLFFLFLANAFAQDCTSLNLVTAENSPFKKIPVYDQDGIGVCYAYAAAQLLDYQIVKSGGQRSVHPLWAAIRYAELNNSEKLSSGSTGYAAREIIKNGNCDYNTVSDALGVLARKANAKESEVMDVIERLGKTMALKKRGNDPLTDQEMTAAISEALQEHRSVCYSNAVWDNIMPELKAFNALGARSMMSKILMPVCYDVLSFPRYKEPRYEELNGDFTDVIGKKIDSLQSPVSISYCSKVLYDTTFDGNKSMNTPNCGGHESLIVGKKSIGGQCHFLLRNSWGTGFGRQTQNFSCLCKNKTTGEYVDDCRNSSHNNGQYLVEGCWINSSDLNRNTQGFTYIPK